MSGAICVFDSSALLTFLKGEPGKDIAKNPLTDVTNTRLAHALNFTEVFYDQWRARGDVLAQAALGMLTGMGLEIREDLDTAFCLDAGRIKAEERKVSLADCCGLALARRVGGSFYTTDHRELDPLAATFPITFIRTDAEYRAWVAAGRPPL